MLRLSIIEDIRPEAWSEHKGWISVDDVQRSEGIELNISFFFPKWFSLVMLEYLAYT